jgi:signal peptidase I
MKNAHRLHVNHNNPRVLLAVLGGAALFSLVLLVPGLAHGMTPTSSVPYAQAVADAQRVASLHPQWQVLKVSGESMEPEFGDASLLLVSRADMDMLHAGMVAVYRDATGDLVAHRLIAPTANGWIVKGLNNDRPDPGVVTAQNLLGVVFGVLHYQDGSENLAAANTVTSPELAYAKRY